MNNEDIIRKRKKGGFLVAFGILLLIISPALFILGNIIPTLFLLIIGVILLFYGLNMWKKAMHQMRISHVAIHAGKPELAKFESKQKSITKRITLKKAFLIGIGIGIINTISGILFGLYAGSLRNITLAYNYIWIYLLIGIILVFFISYSYLHSRKLGLLCAAGAITFPFVLGIIFLIILNSANVNPFEYVQAFLFDLSFIFSVICLPIAGVLGGHLSQSYEDITFETPQTHTSSLKISTDICPNCKNQIAKTAKFCPKCGSSLTRNCSKCNKVVTIFTKFCPKCGNKL